jgi:acetoin utilization protein AcuB
MEPHEDRLDRLTRILVREVMQKNVVTISASERLSMVQDIMTLGHVRHMPVVQAGKLVGVVSERDLLRASLSHLTGHRDEERRAFLHVVEIGRVMSTPPIVTTPESTIAESARVMAERKIGCLPVVDRHALVGMLTETDVLQLVAGVHPALAHPADPPDPGPGAGV